MDRAAAQELATQLYRALSAGDRDGLDRLLHPAFEGHATEGLPLGLGGDYHGPAEMRRDFWGRIGRSYAACAVPGEFALLDDGRLMVRGRYEGKARSGGLLDAEFVHVLSFADDRISGLEQLTDSGRWAEALATGDFKTVKFTVTDGVGELRLNRPEARNALNQTAADELYEVALRCAARDDLRALLITGEGPAFTVGGDIATFAEAEPGALPAVLRRMIGPYHEALRIFSSLNAPVVVAARGAVAGGGLGLLYIADVVFAAEATKFATGFTALGLSGDGGNSWFLPRLIGIRRAFQLYYEQRVLDAMEAAEWGLVTHVVAADSLDEQALSAARGLAAGPTAAFSEIRRLLRDSWSATLSDQLAHEVAAITRAAGTADAGRAVSAFLAKQAPTFEGR